MATNLETELKRFEQNHRKKTIYEEIKGSAFAYSDINNLQFIAWDKPEEKSCGEKFLVCCVGINYGQGVPAEKDIIATGNVLKRIRKNAKMVLKKAGINTDNFDILFMNLSPLMTKDKWREIDDDAENRKKFFELHQKLFGDHYIKEIQNIEEIQKAIKNNKLIWIFHTKSVWNELNELRESLKISEKCCYFTHNLAYSFFTDKSIFKKSEIKLESSSSHSDST